MIFTKAISLLVTTALNYIQCITNVKMASPAPSSVEDHTCVFCIDKPELKDFCELYSAAHAYGSTFQGQDGARFTFWICGSIPGSLVTNKKFANMIMMVERAVVERALLRVDPIIAKHPKMAQILEKRKYAGSGCVEGDPNPRAQEDSTGVTLHDLPLWVRLDLIRNVLIALMCGAENGPLFKFKGVDGTHVPIACRPQQFMNWCDAYAQALAEVAEVDPSVLVAAAVPDAQLPQMAATGRGQLPNSTDSTLSLQSKYNALSAEFTKLKLEMADLRKLPLPAQVARDLPQSAQVAIDAITQIATRAAMGSSNPVSDIPVAYAQPFMSPLGASGMLPSSSGYAPVQPFMSPLGASDMSTPLGTSGMLTPIAFGMSRPPLPISVSANSTWAQHGPQWGTVLSTPQGQDWVDLSRVKHNVPCRNGQRCPHKGTGDCQFNHDV